MTPTEPLTVDQADLFHFIRDYSAQHGVPPSYPEMCRHRGVTSNNAIAGMLREMERKGYIRIDPAKARAIEILADEHPLAVLSQKSGVRAYLPGRLLSPDEARELAARLIAAANEVETW